MASDCVDKLREAYQEAVEELKHGKFWTDRRDAADALTDGAIGTASNLKQMLDDPDIDVRTACRQCFDRLRNALDMPKLHHAEAEPSPAPASGLEVTEQPAFEEMIKEIGSQPGRTYRPIQQGFEIMCRTSSGRQQKVHVRPGQTDASGKTTVQVYSTCAPADEHTFSWALETNCKLRLGALAIAKSGGRDMFVLMNTHLENSLSADELEADLVYIAETSDWIEQQLTGGDVH